MNNGPMKVGAWPSLLTSWNCLYVVTVTLNSPRLKVGLIPNTQWCEELVQKEAISLSW